MCTYTFENKPIAGGSPVATITTVTAKRVKTIVPVVVPYILYVYPLVYFTVIIKSADSGLMGLKCIPYTVTLRIFHIIGFSRGR
jgi:hypothetical protein